MKKIRLDVHRSGRLLLALPVALLLCLQSLFGQTTGAYKNAAEAIGAAQSNGQYLFLLFYDKKDSSFKAMESSINNAKIGSSKSVLLYEAKTTDAKEKDTIAKYRVSRAPLPLVLVVAPNGAITGGFPQKVSVTELQKSITVSKTVTGILKAVQQGKIALVLLQNSKTKFNSESATAAQEFAGDARLKGMVDIIKADPGDQKNSSFLKDSKISPNMSESTIAMVIPPGTIAGVYSGKTSKDTLISALASCSSGGCGSGSGGCSDRRFKNNISPIETPLDKVSKLNGVTFTWDREKFPLRLFPEGRKIGLIAQEVESVVPEVVNTDKEGYKSVEYDKLVALLVEGIKEMKQQILKQETVIQEQGERIRELETAVK